MWFQGNLHCHSTNSDGDSSPQAVARVYKDAGFHFVAVSDHNHLTTSEDCGDLGPDFLVLSASEYSAKVGDVAVHVNGIGLTQPFVVSKDKDVPGTMQDAVDQTLAQGGVSMINHPNWLWSFGAKEMSQVRGAHLMELYAGAYTSNNEGSATRPSSEAIWDDLLSRGIRLWGAGTDDCHKFLPTFNPFNDAPASAWVVVRAESLTRENILNALMAGDFYATTRIMLDDLRADRNGLSLKIKPWGKIEYTTTFIGKGGKVLSVADGLEPSYRIRGDEGYVRARINCTDRLMAWTQPIFL